MEALCPHVCQASLYVLQLNRGTKGLAHKQYQWRLMGLSYGRAGARIIM
jgi:hypothetical protein